MDNIDRLEVVVELDLSQKISIFLWERILGKTQHSHVVAYREVQK